MESDKFNEEMMKAMQSFGREVSGFGIVAYSKPKGRRFASVLAEESPSRDAMNCIVGSIVRGWATDETEEE